MYNEQLTQALAINGAPLHPANQGAGAVNTGGIDMQLYKRVLYIIDVGVMTGGSTVDAKLQESSDNATFTDLAGTNVAITQLLAAGGNNRVVTLECRVDQMTKRYSRVLVTVGTAASFLCVIPLAGEAVHKPGGAGAGAGGNVAAVVQQQVVA